MTDRVEIVEVGLRDGLQNEATPVPASLRAQWFNALSAAGLNRIEAGSFVSPKWVPQMADTETVIQAIDHRPGLSVEALIPNQKGLEAAMGVNGIDRLAFFTAASDAFTRKNINCTVEESLERFAPLMKQAKDAGYGVRGYVSCIVGCPYAGPIEPAAVARVCEKMMAMGVDELSLGDTIGVARPLEINRVLDAVLPAVPVERLALHCHDTYGQALANVLTGLERGVRTFDSAVAGLGGCPYAKGASGNLATEDLLYLLDGQGLETGVSLDRVFEVGQEVCSHLGKESPSRVAQALGARSQTA
ncbi:hydroxymethylglutaryl-CoA lyase [Halospina denitrificans]|uniref:Hydroxymethylglutaryl-CoA lyase n=1 Tax=Halospina denitrificans TaxID=332522 RepID=A0A4R7JU07_9GAMM|nr:hydroxymethylglutaryl-CoA lyase [Halospina denitrificans]TDT41384.1 hydroxymethylglutaryl-CoA lyase [Halospina denitrificans]